jgi:putative aldouronate transport system permease protein
VGNVILLMNFFRGVPKEIEEAALIDGATQWVVMWRIYLPISVPCIATILLFTTIGAWNSWFDGFLYMNRTSNYPLQTYLATLVMAMSQLTKDDMTPEDLKRMEELSDKTIIMAQVFLGALPIMIIYPFMQKYFVKGIVVGSVKG